MDVKITGSTFKDLSKKAGIGMSIFGVLNLEFRGNTFDNIGKADGTSGNALVSIRDIGFVDHVSISNNTFKGSNTKVAIQREVTNEPSSEHNRVKNNIFLGSDKVCLLAV
jgi:hypothetical protein